MQHGRTLSAPRHLEFLLVALFFIGLSPLSAAAQTTSYLSDLTWSSATNGWGPVERDRSNGETAAGDGQTLTINGATYAKGLGVNAASDIKYTISNGCSVFNAVVGVDDEVGSRGNLAFQVWTDGTKKYDSGTMTGTMAGQAVSVPLTGVNVLELVVTIGSDGVNYYDHGDWADAKVTCGGGSGGGSGSGTGGGAGDTTGLIVIQPGQDIQAAINAAPAGAGFLLKAGTYRSQNLTPKSNQSFTGENGAVLTGGKLLTSFARSGATWVASGQTQQGQFIVPSGSCRTSDPKCGYPEDLFVDNVPLEHVSNFSDGAPGKWFFDYNADQIYMWDNPAGHSVETSVTPQAFGGFATGVTLNNLVIEKYATPTAYAAVSAGISWLIENCEVRLNHFSGISSGASSTAQNNYVHNNGGLGMEGSGPNIVVQNNEIASNGYAGYTPYWGSGGSKWVMTQHLTVTGNYSHDNLGPGLWTDIDNIYVLYENNTTDNNERGGIFHELGYDATIRYNTSRGNGWPHDFPGWTTGAGIEIVDSPNVEVYSNTLVDNWQGITGLDDLRGNGGYGPWVLQNFYVHDNNITTHISDVGGGRTGMIGFDGTQAFTAAGNNRFRHNTYALGTNANYFIWLGEQNEAGWRGYGQDTDGTFTR